MDIGAISMHIPHERFFTVLLVECYKHAHKASPQLVNGLLVSHCIRVMRDLITLN